MSRHAELENAAPSCASTRNTYKTWNRTVGTVKKSTDTKAAQVIVQKGPPSL